MVTKMKKIDRPPSIGECVKSAFALARDAKRLRDRIEKHLPTTAPAGHDHAVAHRTCMILGDLVNGFQHLEDKLAENNSLGRCLT
jgi:hypothetical protein